MTANGQQLGGDSITELSPEDRGRYLLTTRDSRLVVDLDRMKVWRFPGPKAQEVSFPSTRLRERPAIRVGQPVHFGIPNTPGGYWSSELQSIYRLSRKLDESGRHPLTAVLDSGLRVDVVGEFRLSMPDLDMRTEAATFDVALKLMVKRFRQWAQYFLSDPKAHQLTLADELFAELATVSSDAELFTWLAGGTPEPQRQPNAYAVDENGSRVIVGPHPSMRPPRVRIVFHDGQEAIFDRPDARMHLVQTPDHLAPGISGRVESFSDLHAGLVGHWKIDGQRWDFGRIVFVEELWQETDEAWEMRPWSRGPTVDPAQHSRLDLSLLSPAARGRLVIETTNATVLIVDLDEMTFARRPGPDAPRRALTSWRLRGFAAGIEGRASWALGERDWFLSTPLTSITPWAETPYPVRQKELRELIPKTADDEDGGGLLWFLARYGPPINMDIFGTPDAVEYLVADVRNAARRSHNLDNTAWEVEYETALVEFIDLSTNAELAQRLHDELDASAGDRDAPGSRGEGGLDAFQ